MLYFENERGMYSATEPNGRRWTITQAVTGWQLEFTDPGDPRATFAGVHRTLFLAQSAAGPVVHGTTSASARAR